MIGFPAHGILITQDLVYNRVHAMVGEKAFEGWRNTLETKKAANYDSILPGHGAPGGKELYGLMQHYLSTALDLYARATDGEDLKSEMIHAFPDYGGIGMLDQQKRFLFPRGKGPRRLNATETERTKEELMVGRRLAVCGGIVAAAFLLALPAS